MDGDSRSEADESVPSEPSIDAAPVPAEDVAADEDLAVDLDLFADGDEGLAVDLDLFADGDEGLAVDLDLFADDDGDLAVEEDLVADVDEDVDEEPPADVDGPDGSANAMPGVAMATPTPRVTANAPTRPICLAKPMTVLP